MKKSLLLFSFLLLASLAWSQSAPTILKWDKTGCQTNLVDEINFDDNFLTASCLQVCKNSMMIYRLIGTDMPNVTNVEWIVTGGAIEKNDEFAVISWDNTTEGTIDIKLTFIDNTIVQRAICVEKLESQLVLSWDRIGCQAEENNVSEIKFSNMSLAIPCLKVCKDTKPIFSLTGDNLTNIQTIQWLVTGGVADTPNDFKTNIVWDATSTGYITVRIKYLTGAIVQKSICVNKINSTLLLEWAKIDDNSVHEIKLVNTDANKESIMIYDTNTIDYTIKGTNKSTIASVYWEIIGGFTANDHGFTVPITWTDEDIKELIVHISYVDGTTTDENFAVLSKATVPCCPPPLAPNIIAFDYDISGNQIVRKFIYVSSGTYRKSKPAVVVQPKTEQLLKSDIYKDIMYYPNPVQSELFVHWSNTPTNAVENAALYSATGQLMCRFDALKSQANLNINFEPYPSGFYFLNLSYTDGNVKDLRIIKK